MPDKQDSNPLSYITAPGIAAPCNKLDSHISFCLKNLFRGLKENTANKILPIISQNNLTFLRQNDSTIKNMNNFLNKFLLLQLFLYNHYW